MRIVLDAMGSDNFPSPDIEGAVLAAREYGDTIILVGDETIIRPELAKYDTNSLSIEVVHTPEYVHHSDSPSKVGRNKPQSSMHVGLRLVADGQAQAFVTAGNTGAALAISTLHSLGRIRGVRRPMLLGVMYVMGRPIALADIGANADCKPDWLLQFAQMGHIYAEKALKLPNPRIGLLSNGEEETKGNDLIRETAPLLKASDLNFVGNVEPKEILLGGAVDVAIADGLMMNVFIKTLEAFGSTLFTLLRNELKADTRSKVAGLLGKPAFLRVYRQVDPFEIGGTLLLGLDGVVVIAHGRTNALGVKNSIRQAREAVMDEIVSAIREKLTGA